MERIDGFLCIDNYKIELAYEHHKKNDHYWVYINNEEYYFKPTDNCYNELLGYHAATILGIDACYCDLAILNGKKGIISKSLRKENTNLTSGLQILNEYAYSSIYNLYWIKKMMDDTSLTKKMWFNDKYREKSNLIANGIHDLENIWYALEYKYKDEKSFNIEKVMNQIVSMYIYSLLSYDTDKYATNWLIEEGEDDIELAPIYDNEDAFNYTKDKLNQRTRFSGSTTSKTYDYNQLEAIEIFLQTSSSEYLELFWEMYYKLLNNFDEIIKKAEKQIGVTLPIHKKLTIINGFYKNMDQIKSYLEQHKTFKTK